MTIFPFVFTDSIAFSTAYRTARGATPTGDPRCASHCYDLCAEGQDDGRSAFVDVLQILNRIGKELGEEVHRPLEEMLPEVIEAWVRYEVQVRPQSGRGHARTAEAATMGARSPIGGRSKPGRTSGSRK
jgi:hypothetical protein